MVASNNLAYTFVELDGFRQLMKAAQPRYVVPSRYKVKAELLAAKYDYFVEIIKTKLGNVKNFTITTDIWSSSYTTQSYLGVTAHYLDDFNFESFVIGTIPLSESHTANTISRHLNECLENWGINKTKIVVFVTDNAANMVKAVELLMGKGKWKTKI